MIPRFGVLALRLFCDPSRSEPDAAFLGNHPRGYLESFARGISDNWRLSSGVEPQELEVQETACLIKAWSAMISRMCSGFKMSWGSSPSMFDLS